MQLNYEKVILLAVGFLLLFSAFFTASGLSGKVLTDNGFGSLGYTSVGALYVSFAVCSFFSSKVVNKCGERLSLFFGALCYTGYIATFILSSYRGTQTDPT